MIKCEMESKVGENDGNGVKERSSVALPASSTLEPVVEAMLNAPLTLAHIAKGFLTSEYPSRKVVKPSNVQALPLVTPAVTADGIPPPAVVEEEKCETVPEEKHKEEHEGRHNVVEREQGEAEKGEQHTSAEQVQDKKCAKGRRKKLEVIEVKEVRKLVRSYRCRICSAPAASVQRLMEHWDKVHNIQVEEAPRIIPSDQRDEKEDQENISKLLESLESKPIRSRSRSSSSSTTSSDSKHESAFHGSNSQRKYKTRKVASKDPDRSKNVKWLRCEICFMDFSESYRFEDHKRMHSEARLIQCQCCGMHFHFEYHLKNHLKISPQPASQPQPLTGDNSKAILKSSQNPQKSCEDLSVKPIKQQNGQVSEESLSNQNAEKSNKPDSEKAKENSTEVEFQPKQGEQNCKTFNEKKSEFETVQEAGNSSENRNLTSTVELNAQNLDETANICKAKDAEEKSENLKEASERGEEKLENLEEESNKGEEKCKHQEPSSKGEQEIQEKPLDFDEKSEPLKPSSQIDEKTLGDKEKPDCIVKTSKAGGIISETEKCEVKSPTAGEISHSVEEKSPSSKETCEEKCEENPNLETTVSSKLITANASIPDVPAEETCKETAVEHKCPHEGCMNAYENRKCLLYHLIHHDGLHRCPTCEKTFYREPFLRRHIYRYHTRIRQQINKKNKEPQKISYSSIKLTNIKKRLVFLSNRKGNKGSSIHNSSNKKSFLLSTCPYCHLEFKGTNNIKIHIVTMHSESAEKRPYPCPMCPLRFTATAYLKRHLSKFHESEDANEKSLMKKALQERLFKCSLCPSSYTGKNHLTNHLRQKHGLDNDGQEISTNADETSSDKSLHVLDKNVTELMSQSSDDAGGTEENQQQMLKTLERPFQCEHCPKRFTAVQYRLRHFNQFHKAAERKSGPAKRNTGQLRPFKCPNCPMTFTAKMYRSKHVNAIHANDPDEGSSGEDVKLSFAPASSLDKKVFVGRPLNKLALARRESVVDPSFVDGLPIIRRRRKTVPTVEVDTNSSSERSAEAETKNSGNSQPEKTQEEDNESVNESGSDSEGSDIKPKWKDPLGPCPFAEKKDPNDNGLNRAPYVCPRCEKKYTAIWNLNRHIEVSHDGVRNGPGRMRKEERKKMKVVDPLGPLDEIEKEPGDNGYNRAPYICPRCGVERSYSQLFSLNRHIKSHHQDGYKPPENISSFRRRGIKIKKEKKENTADQVKCPICSMSLSSQSYLERHLRSAHDQQQTIDDTGLPERKRSRRKNPNPEATLETDNSADEGSPPSPKVVKINEDKVPVGDSEIIRVESEAATQCAETDDNIRKNNSAESIMDSSILPDEQLNLEIAVETNVSSATEEVESNLVEKQISPCKTEDTEESTAVEKEINKIPQQIENVSQEEYILPDHHETLSQDLDVNSVSLKTMSADKHGEVHTEETLVTIDHTDIHEGEANKERNHTQGTLLNLNAIDHTAVNPEAEGRFTQVKLEPQEVLVSSDYENVMEVDQQVAAETEENEGCSRGSVMIKSENVDAPLNVFYQGDDESRRRESSVETTFLGDSLKKDRQIIRRSPSKRKITPSKKRSDDIHDLAPRKSKRSRKSNKNPSPVLKIKLEPKNTNEDEIIGPSGSDSDDLFTPCKIIKTDGTKIVLQLNPSNPKMTTTVTKTMTSSQKKKMIQNIFSRETHTSKPINLPIASTTNNKPLESSVLPTKRSKTPHVRIKRLPASHTEQTAIPTSSKKASTVTKQTNTATPTRVGRSSGSSTKQSRISTPSNLMELATSASTKTNKATARVDTKGIKLCIVCQMEVGKSNFIRHINDCLKKAKNIVKEREKFNRSGYFLCKCDKVFLTDVGLKRHLKYFDCSQQKTINITGEYKCSYCSRTYSHKGNQGRHEKTCTEKPKKT